MPAIASHADALRVEVSSVDVENLRPTGTIHGVVVNSAAGRNGPGTGRIRSIGNVLGWKAPGSNTWGDGVACAADGEYLLEDGEDRDKFVRVQVYADYLLEGADEAVVELADVYENDVGQADLTAGEATAGDVLDYEVTLENVSNNWLSQITVWIEPGTAGLEISDDDAAYVSPKVESAGLEFADLAPGASHTLYLRRTIAAGAGSDPDVLNHLHISFHGL